MSDDSNPNVDAVSIGSTPKPSLKPFFNSSRNLKGKEEDEDTSRIGGRYPGLVDARSEYLGSLIETKTLVCTQTHYKAAGYVRTSIKSLAG